MSCSVPSPAADAMPPRSSTPPIVSMCAARIEDPLGPTSIAMTARPQTWTASPRLVLGSGRVGGCRHWCRNLIHRLLELAECPTKRVAHLRQATRTEDQQGDHADDEQLGPVKSHGSPPTDWFWFSQSCPRGRAGRGAAPFRGTPPAPPAGLLAVARCRHPPAIAKRLNNAMTIATLFRFMAHTVSTAKIGRASCR